MCFATGKNAQWSQDTKIPNSEPPPDACIFLTPKRNTNCSKVKFTRLKRGSGEYMLNTDVSVRAVLEGKFVSEIYILLN